MWLQNLKFSQEAPADSFNSKTNEAGDESHLQHKNEIIEFLKIIGELTSACLKSPNMTKDSPP